MKIRFILCALLAGALSYGQTQLQIDNRTGNINRGYNLGPGRAISILDGASVTFGVGSVLTVNGAFNGTPTGGSLNLANVTVSGLPEGDVTESELNAALADKADTSSLADVATSGDAADLTGTLAPARIGTGSALQLVRRNSANNALEFVDPSGGDLTGTDLVNTQVLYVIDAVTGELGSIPGLTYNSTTGALSIAGNLSLTGNVNLTSALGLGSGGTGFTTIAENQMYLGGPGGTLTKVYIAEGDGMDISLADGILTFSSTASGSTFPLPLYAAIPTVNIGSLPADWIIGGEYGTVAEVTDNFTKVVQSLGTVADPTVDVAPGEVPSGTVVTLSSTTPSAFFTTTTTGTDPTYSSGTVGNTFTVTEAVTVEARANLLGHISSNVVPFAYTVASEDPYFVYASGFDVTATGTDSNMSDANAARGAKITIPGTGTVTKLGVFFRFVNATSSFKIALYNSSKVLVGTGVSTTITTGANTWHDFTVSEAVTAGTYYVGIVQDGPYGGSLVTKALSGQPSGDGLGTATDANTFTNFPGSITWVDNTTSVGLRVEFTP